MNNEELIDLALGLVSANSENEVINLLESKNLWDNENAWRLYGDKENNYSTIGAQQSRPEAALVEKLINSVDSVLTSECLRNKINPESAEAPKTIRNAVSQFFNIHNGMLYNITPTERTKLADRIGLVATGKTAKKGYACYSIFDNGEGQTPNKMPKTFLSIGEKNKLKIPFVQGKFNMGSTGVLRFCGKRNLQLILTKRNPDLLIKDEDSTADKWGFTVVKRIYPDGNYKSSRYVYLVNPSSNNPESNQVFHFNADSLPILPGKYPIAHQQPMYYGSYIKLYEYQMEGLRTNLTLDPYNRLSLLMPSLALPIRIYERREGYQANSAETTLNGLSVRLEEDKRNNLESDEWPSSHDLSVLGEKMKMKVYAFKKDFTTNKKPTQKYVKEEGIIFTINGQTHGFINKRFFHRRAIGLGNLSDSLIVTVDCSEISGETREDLFMNSRDRLVDSSELRNEIEKQLEKILKEHPGLRDLKHKRHKEEIENKLDDSKPLVDIVENIMKRSPSLSTLFSKGFRIKNPFKLKDTESETKYEGKLFPTFFKIDKESSEQRPKECPLNQTSFRVQFSTDVSNDYFDREIDKGEHTLLINGVEFEGTKALNLWNGHATLNINTNDLFLNGSVYEFTSIVSDVNHLEPFINKFYVKMVAPSKQNRGQNGGRKNPPSNKNGKGDKNSDDLALPNVIEVSHGDNNWNSKSFNQYTALYTENNGEDLGWAFYINTDNIHLLNEQKINNVDVSILKAQYKYSLVIMGMSMIKASEDKILIEQEELELSKMISMFTSSISPVVLPLLASLGELGEMEILTI
ncbi:MAG: hypothetical protein AAF554_16945 [Bacteroidota bacterium]